MKRKDILQRGKIGDTDGNAECDANGNPEHAGERTGPSTQQQTPLAMDVTT
jgi:hypothetical protein